jgi:cold shock CspA family protein
MLISWKSGIPGERRGPVKKGRIAHLSHGRLCGVIRAGDGQRVFFHGRDLDGARYNDVSVGACVTFELIADPISGPRATRVRVAAAAKRSPR